MAKTINNMSGIKQETPTNIILNAGKSVYIRVGGYDPSDPTLTPDLNETVPEEVSSGTGNIVISGRDGEVVMKTMDDGSYHITVSKGNVVYNVSQGNVSFNVPNGSFSVNAKGDHIEFAGADRTSTVKGNSNSVVEGESGTVVLGSNNTTTVGNAARLNVGTVENFLLGAVFDLALANVMQYNMGGIERYSSYTNELSPSHLGQYEFKQHTTGINMESHGAAHLHDCEGPTILGGGAIVILPE